MAEAGGAEPGKPPPVASLERALDQVCDFLSRAEQTARVRALVIEARRLRNVVGNWRSIAPDPDVREEMIARVLRLANDAEDVVAAERPSSSQEDPSAAFDSPTIRQDLPPLGHQHPHGMGLRLGPGPMTGGHPGMQPPIKGPPQTAAMFLAGLSGEHGERGAPQGHAAMHGAPAPALPPGPERHVGGPVVTRVVDLSATLSSPGLVSSGPGAASSPALPVPIERVIAPPARDVGVRDAAGPPAGAPPLERSFSGTFHSPPSLVFDRVVPPASRDLNVTVREVPQPPRQQQPPPPAKPLERSGTAAFSSPPSLIFNRVVSTPAHQAVDAKLQSLDPTFEEPPSLHIEHMRSLPGPPESPGRLPQESLGGPGEVTVRPLPLPDAVDPNIVMIHAPYSPQADAYRTLRRKLPSGSGTTVAVTSAGPGEGKTSCAINLALALRETVRGKILLVEANIRKPGIAKALRFEPPSCFTEQLQRHATDRFAPWVVVDQAAPAPAVAPGDEGIESSDRNAAPMGSRSPDPRLSLQTPVHILAVDPRTERPPILDAVAFSTAIESLKRAGYSYIVIDTPPVLGSMDMNVIGDSVDGVLLTSLVKKSTRKAIRQAIDQLRPAPILGVVLLDA